MVAGYSRLFPGDEKESFAGLRAFKIVRREK